ncbi:MAG: zinc metalloprotease HtpX [Desulfobacteraceae bacterium]|nr:MAG: zinc metalloprotease HtpX [Desulfobacteraceae bacterium]
MGNWFKTALLLGALTALIVWVGNLFGGRQGMMIAFVLAIGMNFFSYWFSDKIVLRMYRASEVSQAESPELYDIVRTIAFKADMPMPRIYIIPEDSPNAFATGRNPEHAVVAVTRGLLELMNRDEIMGVLAHEMAHVRNRDILIGSIAATMAGAIMILANMARWTAFLGGGSRDREGGYGAVGMLVAAIVAPIAAMLIQMAVSRSREYHADETGADLAGHPMGLASALQKLGAYSKRIPMQAQANTAHMFIVNPLSAGSLANLFSTHPPLEERIARLMGGKSMPPRGENRGEGGYDEDRGRKQAEDAWRHLSR